MLAFARLDGPASEARESQRKPEISGARQDGFVFAPQSTSITSHFFGIHCKRGLIMSLVAEDKAKVVRVASFPGNCGRKPGVHV